MASLSIDDWSALASQTLAYGSWLILGLLSWILGVCIYRLTLHPYAKYPGPWLGKLTTWYSIYHVWRGDLHKDMYKQHEKYGDYVRYTPNRLLINTSAGLKAINSHGANVRKPDSYMRISLVKGAASTLNSIDKSVHGRKRRILGQGLSDAHLREMEPGLLRMVDILLKRLGEKQDDFGPVVPLDSEGWTCPKNMARWSDYFTFDTASLLVFGKSFDMLRSKDSHFIIHAIAGQAKRVGFITQMPLIEDLRLGRVLYPGAMEKAIRFSMASKAITEARKAEGIEGRNDIYSKVLAAKDPETGNGFGLLELWAESNLLIIAGAETTSTALAAVFFYLSRNPSAHEKLNREIRTAFPKGVPVALGPTLNSCVYLRAVLEESLRLCPSAGGAFWRQVLPGGLTVDGTQHIPADYEVSTGIYAIHHNAAYYPDPFEFRPERWLVGEGTSREEVERAKSAFSAFLIGPRGCIGKGLAIAQVLVSVAAVAREFDFRAAEGEWGRVGEDEEEFAGQFRTTYAWTSEKDGPYIQFRRREQ